MNLIFKEKFLYLLFLQIQYLVGLGLSLGKEICKTDPSSENSIKIILMPQYLHQDLKLHSFHSDLAKDTYKLVCFPSF